jgi:hypothetical protein
MKIKWILFLLLLLILWSCDDIARGAGDLVEGLLLLFFFMLKVGFVILVIYVIFVIAANLFSGKK